MEKEWEISEVNYLKINFENTTNVELSKILKRSKSSIQSKANSLGLKKSKEHKSKMITKRNKMVNRDLTYDKLKEISLLYKTRAEFQISDGSAYTSARIMGILDDICTHMIKQSFSIPQLMLKYIVSELITTNLLYNTRKIISPYEIDIFLPEYKLAFEYDGKGWHQNDEVDKVNLCNDRGILLIKIKENNRKYEIDIKTQLIEKIEVINNRCFCNIDKEDIINLKIDKSIYDNILDYEEIMKICSKYEDFSKFRKENLKLYYKLISLKSLDKFTKFMNRNRTEYSEDFLKIELEKYKSISELLEKCPKYYTYIKRNKKYDYLLDDLEKEKRTITYEMCIELIQKNKIKTKYQLRNVDSSLYVYLKRTIGLNKINEILYKDQSI